MARCHVLKLQGLERPVKQVIFEVLHGIMNMADIDRVLDIQLIGMCYTHVQNQSIKFHMNPKISKQSEAMRPSENVQFSARFRVMFKPF